MKRVSRLIRDMPQKSYEIVSQWKSYFLNILCAVHCLCACAHVCVLTKIGQYIWLALVSPSMIFTEPWNINLLILNMLAEQLVPKNAMVDFEAITSLISLQIWVTQAWTWTPVSIEFLNNSILSRITTWTLTQTVKCCSILFLNSIVSIW